MERHVTSYKEYTLSSIRLLGRRRSLRHCELVKIPWIRHKARSNRTVNQFLENYRHKILVSWGRNSFVRATDIFIHRDSEWVKLGTDRVLQYANSGNKESN